MVDNRSSFTIAHNAIVNDMLIRNDLFTVAVILANSQSSASTNSPTCFLGMTNRCAPAPAG